MERLVRAILGYEQENDEIFVWENGMRIVAIYKNENVEIYGEIVRKNGLIDYPKPAQEKFPQLDD